MKVKELILELMELDQEQEIRFESYEFSNDFKIGSIAEHECGGETYYCILEEE